MDEDRSSHNSVDTSKRDASENQSNVHYGDGRRRHQEESRDLDQYSQADGSEKSFSGLDIQNNEDLDNVQASQDQEEIEGGLEDHLNDDEDGEEENDIELDNEGSEEISHDDDNNMEDFDDEDYKEEAKQLDENIPERKVRYRILRFINKLRAEFKLTEFYEDFLGNQVAMDYAKYLLGEKENEQELQKM